MNLGKSPSTFLSLSLPSPSLVLLLVCWFPCVAVCIKLLIVVPSSLRFRPFSRLLTVFATSFLIVIFPYVLRLLFQCLCFWCTVSFQFDTSLPQSDLSLICASVSSSWLSNREGCDASHECSIRRIPFFCHKKLSSASIERDIFNFLPRNSFFNMFADLTNLFLPSSFLKWMKACVIDSVGHSSLAFSIVIPISVVDFFQELHDLWQMFRSGILSSLSYPDSCPHVPLDFFNLVFRIFCPCQGFSFYIREYTDLLVSVISFFLHFHNGWVHPV